MNSKLSFSWDLYQNSICNGFSSLQQLGEFVDMTLAADGHFVKVHQTLIALSSPYLRALIKTVPTQHPVIFLDNVCHSTLCYLLEYIYTGEVAVPRDKLYLFTRAAKALCLTGIENILEKQKKDTKETNDEDDIDGINTNMIKMESLPKTHMSQINEINNEDEQPTHDDYFQPHSDTIEIDIESELNIPTKDVNKDVFNESTEDFEKTLRQIRTPLLTPSGSNLGSLVNLRSPIPQLDVSPNDFNCDSNTSFQMDQFFKGLNLSNDENAQAMHNSNEPFTDGQTETQVFNYTIQPNNQKSMPLLDIATIGEGSSNLDNINIETGHCGKGLNRVDAENSISYEENLLFPNKEQKIRIQEGDNSICFSPLLDLIENDNVVGDYGEGDLMAIDSIEMDKDKSQTNIEDFISMPILDETPENSQNPLSDKILNHVQKASKIQICNTGKIFAMPKSPVKKISLRSHRFNRKTSSEGASNSVAVETPASNTTGLQNSIVSEIKPYDETPNIQIHLPETKENMDFAMSSELAMPIIEIFRMSDNPPSNSLPLEEKRSDKETTILKSQPTPKIRIKIPEKQGTNKVRISDVVKGVSIKKPKSKIIHGIQILKIAENLTRKVTTENQLTVETAPESGIRSIKIQHPRYTETGQLVKVERPIKTIKRIKIKKALGKKSQNKEDVQAKPLGFQFKLPESQQGDILPVKEPAINEKTQEKIKEDVIASADQNPTIQITRLKDNETSTPLTLEIPMTSTPSDSMIQYSISNRGSLQIIVNRYIYYSHYQSCRSRRRWRCTNYRRGKCTAYIDTAENCIVSRVNAHNHPFHDRQILQRVRKNQVFSAISDAESFYIKQKKNGFEKEHPDSDE